MGQHQNLLKMFSFRVNGETFYMDLNKFCFNLNIHPFIHLLYLLNPNLRVTGVSWSSSQLSFVKTVDW